MPPLFYPFLFFNLVLGSSGKWNAYVPWKRNVLERDLEPTCSCSDPDAVAWSSDKHFSDVAVSAVVPAGYSQQISDAHTWTHGDGFLGVAVIDEYDAAIGALLCDSIEACSSFQIYFEKEEGFDAIIKVAFWAGAFAVPDSAGANAVIAGLNGYTNTTLSTPDGFEVPSYVGNQAIRPPLGSNYFLDSMVFHGPFDTASCSKECLNLGGKFFNTYVVSKNGVNQGQYCDVYSEAIGHEWATESGSTVGKTNWTISHSFTCSWVGENPGQDPSISSPSASKTTIVPGGGDKGSWEHHHPWHGSGPRTSTSIVGPLTTSTTSKSSSSVHGGKTSTTRWGPGGSIPLDHGTSSTIYQGSSSSLIDPVGHSSTSLPLTGLHTTTSLPSSLATTPAHSATIPSDPNHYTTKSPVLPTTSTSPELFTTVATLIIPTHPIYNGSHSGNGTNHTWGDWLDWNETLSSSTIIPLPVDPATASSTTTSIASTTTSSIETTSGYPSIPAYNATHPWNGTLPNGTHWSDWIFNFTSSSLISTTTSTLIVDPETTTTTPSFSSTTSVAYPSGLPFNGTHTWNGTLPNGTHWSDWIFNETTSSLTTTTTSTLFVDPETTTTTSAYLTSTTYPATFPWNGTLWNGTHWNGTFSNGTHWYDWLYNETTSSQLTTTTTTLFVDPTSLTTSTTTYAYITTTSAYPSGIPYNGSFPNGTHWTDWNITLPLNGTHWSDWLYNETSSSTSVTTTSTTTSTLFVESTTTSTTSVGAYPTGPAFNGTLPNGTHWTDWNVTLPGNGTHWSDWIYNATTSSSTVSTTTTTLFLDPTTTTTTAVTTTTSAYPEYPSYNGTHPSSNSSWAENGCDPTPPSQILKNPSFECSLGGWTLVDGDIVWGGVEAPAKKRKMRKRDIASPDLASDGKGFARLHPSSPSDTATLSQALDTAAENGSYWYSFDYRVPESGDTPAECTLTVSDDEGVLQVVSGLGSAAEWTKTGNEFKVKESVSTFSWEFSCNGADTDSPILDLDNLRLGVSNGTWAFSKGTFGRPPVNGTFSPPPGNLTYPAVAPPTHNETTSTEQTTTVGETEDLTENTGDETEDPTENTESTPQSGDVPGNDTITVPPARRRFKPRRGFNPRW